MIAWIAAGYAVMSVVTAAWYRIDKAAARGNRRRTPERTLHLLALFGGWPGAWFAQAVFRHKSSKAAFRRVFFLTVAVNLAVLGGLLYSHFSTGMWRPIATIDTFTFLNAVRAIG